MKLNLFTLVGGLLFAFNKVLFFIVSGCTHTFHLHTALFLWTWLFLVKFVSHVEVRGYTITCESHAFILVEDNSSCGVSLTGFLIFMCIWSLNFSLIIACFGFLLYVPFSAQSVVVMGPPNIAQQQPSTSTTTTLLGVPLMRTQPKAIVSPDANWPRYVESNRKETANGAGRKSW